MAIKLDPNVPHSPVVIKHRERRAADIQLRIADAITAFAGSMRFVYIHAIGFAIWMVFIEKNPWPKLTLIVSLEAIFLSTFVMIGQNRAAAFQQAKADHDFVEQRVSSRRTPSSPGPSTSSPRTCTRRSSARRELHRRHRAAGRLRPCPP
jgi:hypothetical protein